VDVTADELLASSTSGGRSGELVTPANTSTLLVLEPQKPLLVELRYLVWTPQLALLGITAYGGGKGLEGK
jgi:hypothetical protein